MHAGSETFDVVLEFRLRIRGSYPSIVRRGALEYKSAVKRNRGTREKK
jgi:hypothetical protein